jgi:voltage-gated potassium channel Kch
MPSLASAASSEEVGFVAQEQHGAEVDAALAKASTDVTAERGKQTEEEARARTESDAHVRELKTTADADQATARAGARAEIETARGQWQIEITAKGADARKQADKKVTEGLTQVDAEQSKANAEAKQHIDEGKQKADQEKQKGEKEAADAKDKGKSKSSSFWGWVSSKAKAAFDGIKKAVSSAIDACRRAVKAVIDAAKKLAMAAIELARKAIVAAIKAVGAALIAISNVLLAAFPGLKAKFQAAIRSTVDKAVAAVNKLADGLKKAVQKALDLLGAALDKALQLLEKGINAIIDAANAVVQGALKAAQAIVEALGTWAKLIKDVVAGPGAWISKLGAAVVDGIKNHLWSAFKTAVMDWFKSKVFELLGVGGIILELLLEGGLTKDAIIQMALDALIVAIPAALVMILIEKLVSMIVPAAGALMTIIEGLQAAWGTVIRLIAAFGAFMAFLLAVKSGGAGPLFATVLASAAVVVLDFVANWLLKKLVSAARKVGAKLKGLAEKFKAKRKAKKDAKSPKKHHDEHASPKKHHDHHDTASSKSHHGDDGKPNQDHNGKKSKEEKKKEEIAKRVEKAQRELPPKVRRLLAGKPSKLRVRAQFALWKVTYRLSQFELRGNEGKLEIFAQVNPTVDLGVSGWTFETKAVMKILHDLAGEYLDRGRMAGGPPKGAGGELDLTARPDATGLAGNRQPGPATYRTGKTEGGDDTGYREEIVAFGWGRMKPYEEGSGSNYVALKKKLEGVAVGPALGKMARGEPVPHLTPEQKGALEELCGLWPGGKEASHPKDSFGHQRDLTSSYMLGQLMETKGMTLDEAMAHHPAAFGNAQKGARRMTQEIFDEDFKPPASGSKEEQHYNERRAREKATTEKWFAAHKGELEQWFRARLQLEEKVSDTNPTLRDVEDFVRHQLELYIRTHRQ